jgi:GT2 family glycosyltransferase
VPDTDLAVVLALPLWNADAAKAIEALALSELPLVVVAYHRAAIRDVGAFCMTRNVRAIEAPAGASLGAAVNLGATGLDAAALLIVNGAVPLGRLWKRPLLAALEATGGGVAGPMILGSGDRPPASGYLLSSAPLTLRGFDLQGFNGVNNPLAVDALVSDCLITARATFDELGGFAEGFGSEWEAVDYCLRVSESGRGVRFDPGASFTRIGQPAERAAMNLFGERAFAERWRERAVPHENMWPNLTSRIVRRTFLSVGVLIERVPIPEITVIVHGDTPATPEFTAALNGSLLKPTRIVEPGSDWYETARRLTEMRDSNYVVFVRTDTQLGTDWLNELVNAAEGASDIVASTVIAGWSDAHMPAAADGRCTLVAPRLIPQHVRIEAAASLDEAVTAWIGTAVAMGRNVVRVRRATSTVAPNSAIVPAQAPEPWSGEVFVSIVMLSWNAPQFTEDAIASIRARTSLPHEIIIIDNGSGEETVRRLEAIDGIRVIYNAVNTGFAFGCNQGLAAARGTHVVLLNNDVIVTDGWLEAMIDVQRRNPTVGCSAPRTNRIVGYQQVDNVPYENLDELPAFARERSYAERGRWTREARVVGFCLCLDRRMVAEIGGLNPRYGIGNFEDDDYCMRIRAAGYDIALCDDSFIHHFGNVTFKENKVDYRASLVRNKEIFTKHWNVTWDPGGVSYNGAQLFKRGFIRDHDFVPLPEPAGVGPDWTVPQ